MISEEFLQENSETLSNQSYFEKIFKVFRFHSGKAIGACPVEKSVWEIPISAQKQKN